MREIDTGTLLAMVDAEELLSIIDVREPEEFDEWSIPGARNIPLSELDLRMAEIPDGVIVTVCAAGTRAATAAALLEANDRESLVLSGGMAAWARTYDDVAFHVGDVTVVQVRRRGKGCLSYVVGGAAGCIVIDPSLDLERYTSISRARGLEITAVVDTHLHADHLSGARLLAEITGATLLVNHDDGFAFDAAPLIDGAALKLGNDISLSVLVASTPGHTMGSTTLALADVALFTGDTLFIESVGRPDLADRAEEFAGALFDSLHQRILPFPDETVILPAHVGTSIPVRSGELVGATLGELRASLPALSLDEEAFIAWASTRATPRPPNYEEIVRANRSGSVVEEGVRRDLEQGPNRCAVDSAD